MYSRKFGLRLRGKFGNRLSTRGLSGCNGLRSGRRGLGLCGTGMRPKFYENESSFRLAAETSKLATGRVRPPGGLAACAPRSGKLAKAFATTYLLAALAAAMILSKRLSPRKSSQHGLKRRSPYVGPAGIVATISSCSSATCHAYARRTSHREAATASARARRQFDQTVDRCATNPRSETVSVRRG
jgi:hypothetical protein